MQKCYTTHFSVSTQNQAVQEYPYGRGLQGGEDVLLLFEVPIVRYVENALASDYIGRIPMPQNPFMQGTSHNLHLQPLRPF